MRGATLAEYIGLMYHEVTDDPASSGPQRPGARPYVLTPRRFAEHLEAIADSGLEPRLVTTLGENAPGRHLLLTFDDGGRSALRAAEMLSRHGWRGHFFVVTAWLGRRGFLDASSVREIRAQGHLVGSHSHTHPDIFRALPPQRMLREWRRSRDMLADLLGEPCLAASVPGGDSAPSVFATAAAIGFRHLFTSEPWRLPRYVHGCRVLGRLMVKGHVSAEHLSAWLAGRRWWRAVLARRAKEVVRTGLGPVYRAYVRRRTRSVRVRR